MKPITQWFSAWRAFFALLASVVLVGSGHHVAAQDLNAWPTKALSMVVPFPAGGPADILGRQVAKQLGEVLGVPVVVENKAGAATAIGASFVARAPKDGYTLLLSAGSTFTTTPHLKEQLPYSLKDFEPVGAVATIPFAFVVKKDFPAKTLAEFIDYARANPGKVNNATNGQGSMVHLLGELVGKGLDVKLTMVHYKGAAPSTADMLAGVIDSNVEALTASVPNVRAGNYRALAVLTEKRAPLFPDVPTFKELGYPAIVGETWMSIFAPAGTPKTTIDKLNRALATVIESPEYIEAMRKLGNDPRLTTPAQLLAVTQQESEMWRQLILSLGIKGE